jgi:hypothetical protein
LQERLEAMCAMAKCESLVASRAWDLGSVRISLLASAAVPSTRDGIEPRVE